MGGYPTRSRNRLRSLEELAPEAARLQSGVHRADESCREQHRCRCRGEPRKHSHRLSVLPRLEIKERWHGEQQDDHCRSPERQSPQNKERTGTVPAPQRHPAHQCGDRGRRAYIEDAERRQRNDGSAEEEHQLFPFRFNSRRLRSTARANTSSAAASCSVTASTRNEIGTVGSFAGASKARNPCATACRL